MNLLPFSTQSLVKRVPLFSTREKAIKWLVGYNVVAYGAYRITEQNNRIRYKKHCSVG